MPNAACFKCPVISGEKCTFQKPLLPQSQHSHGPAHPHPLPGSPAPFPLCMASLGSLGCSEILHKVGGGLAALRACMLAFLGFHGNKTKKAQCANLIKETLNMVPPSLPAFITWRGTAPSVFSIYERHWPQKKSPLSFSKLIPFWPE